MIRHILIIVISHIQRVFQGRWCNYICDCPLSYICGSHLCCICRFHIYIPCNSIEYDLFDCVDVCNTRRTFYEYSCAGVWYQFVKMRTTLNMSFYSPGFPLDQTRQLWIYFRKWDHNCKSFSLICKKNNLSNKI